MKKVCIFLNILFSALLISAEPIKIKTIESYIESSNGRKSNFNDKTTVFEVDTTALRLAVKTITGNRSYKMSNRPLITKGQNGTSIKFEVSDGPLIKKYSIHIPNPLIGNKIKVREIMVTRTRELPATVYSTDKYTTDGNAQSFTTKYVTTHFHDINKSGPILENKCSIGFSDSAILIGDLDGTEYTKMLLVTSYEDTSIPSLKKKQITYHCQVKDEQYIFTVNYPESEYSTPIFELTRLVNDQPVFTTIFSGDFIE